MATTHIHRLIIWLIGDSELLFAQSRGIPNTDRLIETGGNNQIFRWMKCSTHDVVIVACQDTETGTSLKIPES